MSSAWRGREPTRFWWGPPFPRRRTRPRRSENCRMSSGSSVTPDIKFCGLTRSSDAQMAAELGAAYVGVIFAGGPRNVTVEQAVAIFSDLPPRVKRVGVFGAQ